MPSQRTLSTITYPLWLSWTGFLLNTNVRFPPIADFRGGRPRLCAISRHPGRNKNGVVTERQFGAVAIDNPS
jgi:hypothetical protein